MTRLNYISFLLLLISFVSCEKEESDSNPGYEMLEEIIYNDFRNDLIGTFEITRYHEYVLHFTPPEYYYDTLIYVAEVKKGVGDSIAIQNPAGEYEVFPIDSSGDFFACDRKYGHIRGNELYMYWDDNSCGRGPRGSSWTNEYFGVRK